MQIKNDWSRNPVHSPLTISKVLKNVIHWPRVAGGMVSQSKKTNTWDGPHAVKGERLASKLERVVLGDRENALLR